MGRLAHALGVSCLAYLSWYGQLLGLGVSVLSLRQASQHKTQDTPNTSQGMRE